MIENIPKEELTLFGEKFFSNNSQFHIFNEMKEAILNNSKSSLIDIFSFITISNNILCKVNVVYNNVFVYFKKKNNESVILSYYLTINFNKRDITHFIISIKKESSYINFELKNNDFILQRAILEEK